MKKGFFVWIILLVLVLPLVKAAIINVASCSHSNMFSIINTTQYQLVNAYLEI